jgi:hypothetical protein
MMVVMLVLPVQLEAQGPVCDNDNHNNTNDDYNITTFIFQTFIS